MKKILVTGGAGFIGSHILEKCSEVPGLSVTVLDNLSSGFKEYVPLSMNLVQMDVRDKALIDFLLQEKFDTVIHLAAQTLVPFSMEYPLVDADINIKGLINLLEGCRKSGVKRIIFSSSAAVYGDNQHLPLTEKEIPAPTSFYGLSKVTAESYIRLYYFTGCMESSCDLPMSMASGREKRVRAVSSVFLPVFFTNISPLPFLATVSRPGTLFM